MVKRNIILSCLGVLFLLMGSCQKPQEGNSPKPGNSGNSGKNQSAGQEDGKGTSQAASSSRKGPPKKIKKTNVRISSVGTDILKIESTFVGYLIPNERVRMTSEMEGVIEAVNFEEADEVNNRQKLINISTKELTLRVKIAETNLKLAQTNLSRDEKLSKRKLIPQSQLDQTRTQADRSLWTGNLL